MFENKHFFFISSSKIHVNIVFNFLFFFFAGHQLETFDAHSLQRQWPQLRKEFIEVRLREGPHQAEEGPHARQIHLWRALQNRQEQVVLRETQVLNKLSNGWLLSFKSINYIKKLVHSFFELILQIDSNTGFKFGIRCERIKKSYENYIFFFVNNGATRGGICADSTCSCLFRYDWYFCLVYSHFYTKKMKTNYTQVKRLHWYFTLILFKFLHKKFPNNVNLMNNDSSHTTILLCVNMYMS